MNDISTEEARLGALCKALGHPMRVRILRLLADHGACQTGSLVDRLPLAQSTISEHLRILREVGLVRGEIDGPHRCYCVDPDAIHELKSLLDQH